MKRHVFLVANAPAVVAGRHSEKRARSQEKLAAIAGAHRSGAGDYEAYVTDLAQLGARNGTNVRCPSPAWLIDCSAQLYVAHTVDFKATAEELSDLVGLADRNDLWRIHEEIGTEDPSGGLGRSC